MLASRWRLEGLTDAGAWTPSASCPRRRKPLEKTKTRQVSKLLYAVFIPLRAKRVKEVANLTERKNLHTPVYGVKEFVCLSGCLWSTLIPIISGLAE